MTDKCSNLGEVRILPNSTQSRICGVASQNASLASSCCGGYKVQSYGCIQYCETSRNLTIGHFLDCLANGNNGSDIASIGAFCQDGIVGDTRDKSTDKASTSGASSITRPPRLSHFLGLILVILALVTDSHAASTIVHSLRTDLVRRASSSCSITMLANYTTVRQAVAVSSTFGFGCNDVYCPMEVQIDTGIDNNNRTINGTSAAGFQYDDFFNMLEGKTNRSFPALSGIQLDYAFAARPASSYYMAFTPIHVSHRACTGSFTG